MDLGDCDRLIVFGGSFDPPHRAHVELPELVRRQLGADLVLYVPAGRAPHKLDREQTPAHHRLAMLELALRGREHAAVCTDEIDRAAHSEPSYTVDTLAALEPRLKPTAQMRLLIGADQVRIFDQWRQPERIVELAEPVVMVRPPDTAASLLASLPDEASRSVWRGRLVEVPRIDVSSTGIRQRVRRGEPIEHLVPAEVARYIEEQGLYR